MDEDLRDRIIQRVFSANCGPAVIYIAHELSARRTLKIEYKIPAVSDARIFTTVGIPKSGLRSALWAIAHRAATSARDHAYLATGQRQADMNRLLQGKLIDEHPRSDAKTAEVSAAATVNPEP